MRPNKTKSTGMVIAGHSTHLSEPIRRFWRGLFVVILAVGSLIALSARGQSNYTGAFHFTTFAGAAIGADGTGKQALFDYPSRGRPDLGEGDTEALAREKAQALLGNIKQLVMKPTRSSFLAKCRPVKGATGYRLDVSTTPSFDRYVSSYRDVDFGNITSHVVTGLNRGTKYYYRVRPYSSAGTGSNSETTTKFLRPDRWEDGLKVPRA